MSQLVTTNNKRTRASKLTVSNPIGRPDRQFYARSNAFGRFGIRWFRPVLMSAAHNHGHIEFNWLSSGHMDYLIDGQNVTIPSRRLVMFWAGIPHQTVALDKGGDGNARQCNVYLPLDAFLHIPHIEKLHEAMMGGGVICLDPDSVGPDTLERWYGDYRSGDPERQDILKVEIGAMLRRAVLLGWEELLPAWIKPANKGVPNGTPMRYVVAMIGYILENLSEPLSLEEVAKVANIHPNYALNLFTGTMRISIRQFIVRMRLVRARAMLFEGNQSIANVAFHSGFNSLSQFYAHFRKAYGVTPLELRKRLIRDET